MGSKKQRNKRTKKYKNINQKIIRDASDTHHVNVDLIDETVTQQEIIQDTRPSWLRFLDNIANWQAFLIIAILGLIIFSTGFNNPFRGDDDLQIVQNVPVHSISNIGSFFAGSTFYSFNDDDPLTGQYYRPLMTTTYSAIYSIFGAEPLYFHLLQALLIIGAVFFLYLILSFSVQKYLALLFSLVYLVHPINSQVVFAIPSMQDALMQLFGLAALWSIIRFKSNRALLGTFLLLTLAILSKESGALYFVMAYIFLIFFDRKRLKVFSVTAVSILIIYALIRNAALGGAETSNIGPIGEASLATRIITVPSIGLFYLNKLFLPINLSSSYNWVVSSISISRVVIPIIVIFSFIVVLIYAGKKIHENAPKIDFATYAYYAIWFFLSICLYLQIVKALDMTAVEPWFAIPLIGLIGMSATFSQYLSDSKRGSQVIIATALLLIIPILGIRTYVRGHDWSSVQRLATQDIRTSDKNYIAYNDLANYYFTNGEHSLAREAAQKSVDLYSTAVNNDTLGRSCMALKQYVCASNAFDKGLSHFDFAATIINKAVLTAYYGDPTKNREYLLSVTKLLSNQPYPWYYLALVDYSKLDMVDEAKSAIQNAYNLSPDPNIKELYRIIMSGEKLNVVIE